MGQSQSVEVHGTVAPGYESVREMFEENFRAGREENAQLCVYVGETRVVDLWASLSNNPAFTGDSLTNVFSRWVQRLFPWFWLSGSVLCILRCYDVGLQHEELDCDLPGAAGGPRSAGLQAAYRPLLAGVRPARQGWACRCEA